MIIKRQRWKIANNFRRLFPLIFLAMIGLGLVTGYQSYVAAEGGNEYPPVTGSGWTNWVLRNVTPDPNLTWAYNSGGRTGEDIEHILKNEPSSQIRRINLKIYYDSQPAQVVFTTRENYCKLDASGSLNSRLQVVVGNDRTGYEVTYDEQARREGMYNASEQYQGRSFNDRFVDDPSANGNTNPNRRFDWRLGNDNSKDHTFQYTAVPSRICDSDPGPERYNVYRFEEQCADANRKSGGVCDNDGNERWQRSDYVNTYSTNDPGNSCEKGGRICQFGGFVHRASGARAEYDPVTEKWVATVRVELTGAENNEQFETGRRGDETNWNRSYDLVKQQIRFKLETPSASTGTFGYGLPTGGLPFARQFGLGAGQFGADADGWEDGVKLALPFGRPCDQPNDTLIQNIRIYDVDSASFGSSFVKIFQRDPDNPSRVTEALSSSYIQVPSENTTYEPATNRMRINGADNGESRFQFRTEFGVQYMAVLVNPKNGSASPLRNVFSIQLPNESIYGIINCKYNLTPTIDDINKTFEYSPDLPLGARIDSNGGAAGGNHDWQITKIEFDTAPTNTHAGQVDSTNAPCVHMASGNSASGPAACENLNDSNEGTSAIYPSNKNYSGSFTSASPYAIGKHVCFMTSVKRPQWNLDPNLWRHSRMVCSQSVKKPRVQFLGSDLKVQGRAIASASTINGTTFGSWVEYGMFSSQVNSFVGSGNGMRDGDNGMMSQWSNLTFANKTGYGDYGQLPAATAAYGYFSGLQTTASGTPNASDIPNGVYTIPGGDLGTSLDRTDESRGAVIIRSQGNVTISRNIEVNNNNLTSVDQVSQVVIVAPNITISPGVGRVDAWLITPQNGSITTCTGSGPMTNTDCNQRLTVNGAVYTNQLRLRRTAGSDPTNIEALRQPAEVFNLRPESILWAYAYANQGDYAQTDYIQELPPRY